MRAEMIVRKVLKPEVQKMVRALRKAGIPVIVKDGMVRYRVTTKEGHDVFIAMMGKHDYLVRMRADLFE